MVGQAILRNLRSVQDRKDIICAVGRTYLAEREHPDVLWRRADLRYRSQVRALYQEIDPEVVYLAAAKVGGIVANASAPADFAADNLLVHTNCIVEAAEAGVQRMVVLGSTCAYPRNAPQPLREEHLGTGPLEQTNRAYATAKLAAVELCRAYNGQHGTEYVVPMCSNLYGTHDSFHLQGGHLLPMLVRKMLLARWLDEGRLATAAADLRVDPSQVRLVLDGVGIRPGSITLWGTGRPRREVLHVDDAAAACVLLGELPGLSGVLQAWGHAHVNVGTGQDFLVKEVARVVADAVGYRGSILWDGGVFPDGTPRKLTCSARMQALGWGGSVGLAEGIGQLVRWYEDQSGGC